MNLSDNKELKQKVDDVLLNWGRWCRDDWRRRLGYSVQPTFKHYRAPQQERMKAREPIDANEAEMANDAIIRIGVKNGPGFDAYRMLVAWYAKGKHPMVLSRQFRCSRASVYRTRDRAMDCFWDEYQDILLQKTKKAK